MSYLTESDHAIAMLVHPQDPAPYFTHVSHTQLSIARHFGGVTIQGHHYTYMSYSDELIRDDVLKAIASVRKMHEKVERNEDRRRADGAQGVLL